MSFTHSNPRTRTISKGVAAVVITFGLTATAGVVTAGTFMGMLGSDTLFDPISLAIMMSGANIMYSGTGSGNGETALLSFAQGIAPMSRNLKSTIIGPGGSHPSWAPTSDNVLALDAAVIVQRNSATKCPNIEEFKSLPGNPATHWLQLLLGGVDGSGSKEACSHPARLAALQGLTDCLGAQQIDHFYRRDDNSGTSDTMQEKLGFCGFCNNGSSAKLSKGSTNLLNADNDPIRRACVTTVGLKPTPCTGGTLGLVVALSEKDSGASDITTTIGKRVVLDLSGQTIGYAGREAAFSVPGATKMNINTIVPSIPNVRVGLYDLSRRLFLQKGDLTQNGMVAALDPTGEQTRLLAWATGIDPAGKYTAMCTDGAGNPICGRPNMDPIMQQFGFVTCTDDPFTPPDGANLCATQAPPYVAPTCTACVADSATCTATSQCCSGVCGTGGKCSVCEASGGLCKVNSDCCSGNCDTVDFSVPTCA